MSAFASLLSSDALSSYLSGNAQCAYSFLGAHPAQQDGKSGWFFRVWAPHAKAVSLAGSFNQWSSSSHPMTSVSGGLWEIFLPNGTVGDDYHYVITAPSGQQLTKCDPFGVYAQIRPGTASRLWDLSAYEWNDGPWLSYRKRQIHHRRPLNIYQLHLGSWRRTGEGHYLGYRDIARWLVPYVKEMGYTAVELMPPMEHYEDESLGFHITGYFAPTSRFGSPDDFKYLVDQLHQAGVAVLMDWVLTKFSAQPHGLALFDGTPCYEGSGSQSAVLTRRFDLSSGPVRSLLLSSACFWLEEYHLDGLRMDDIADLLFFDLPEAQEKNPSGISLIRQLNQIIHSRWPDVLTICEASVRWDGVTAPADSQNPDGLGFDLLWDLLWTEKTLHYLSMDPIYRQYNHKDVTLPLTYANTEQHLLPLPYNQFHGQQTSLLGRMNGSDDMKFASARALHLLQLTLPGKQLAFMGCEFGQFASWRWEYSLDWHLLGYQPFHRHQDFVKAANHFYLTQPALWQQDGSKDSFRWICPDDSSSNVVVFSRLDQSGNALLVAINFSSADRLSYRIGVSVPGTYEAVFHTDALSHGGFGRVDTRPIQSQPISCHHLSDSLLVDLPPLTGIVLRCTGREKPRSSRRSRH